MRLEAKEAQEFRLQQIYTLDQKGYTQNEIAQLTDCTQSWVSQILKRVEEEDVESLQAKESKAGNKAALGEDELADLDKREQSCNLLRFRFFC
jgi:predicted transcriptional regulator